MGTISISVKYAIFCTGTDTVHRKHPGSVKCCPSWKHVYLGCCKHSAQAKVPRRVSAPPHPDNSQEQSDQLATAQIQEGVACGRHDRTLPGCKCISGVIFGIISLDGYQRFSVKKAGSTSVRSLRLYAGHAPWNSLSSTRNRTRFGSRNIPLLLRWFGKFNHAIKDSLETSLICLGKVRSELTLLF